MLLEDDIRGYLTVLLQGAKAFAVEVRCNVRLHSHILNLVGSFDRVVQSFS